MSVTDLAATSAAPSAQRTVDILDQVLGQVRRALARASVVPDPADAACELRALASAAWEAADRIEPLAVEEVLSFAEAIAHAAAMSLEPAAPGLPNDLTGGVPVTEYRPRHSATASAETAWPAPGGHEPTTVPKCHVETGPRHPCRAAGDGASEIPPLGAPALGASTSDQLASPDALLCTSESFVRRRSINTPSL